MRYFWEHNWVRIWFRFLWLDILVEGNIDIASWVRRYIGHLSRVSIVDSTGDFSQFYLEAYTLAGCSVWPLLKHLWKVYTIVVWLLLARVMSPAPWVPRYSSPNMWIRREIWACGYTPALYAQNISHENERAKRRQIGQVGDVHASMLTSAEKTDKIRIWRSHLFRQCYLASKSSLSLQLTLLMIDDPYFWHFSAYVSWLYSGVDVHWSWTQWTMIFEYDSPGKCIFGPFDLGWKNKICDEAVE